MDNEEWHPTSPSLGPEDSRGHTAVHFWAKWDAYDREMDATLAKLREEYGPDLRFRSCDIDLEVNWDLARKAGVLEVPALVLLVEGEPRDLVTGVRPELELRQILDKWCRTS